jgi:hypothetical protein
MRTTMHAFGPVILFVAAGCGHTPAVARPTIVMHATPSANTPDVIGAGSRLLAQFDNAIDTQSSQRGDRFAATVLSPVMDASGSYILPPSARIIGHVASVEPRHAPDRPAKLTLAVDGVYIGETWVPLSAAILALDTSKAGPHGKGISGPFARALHGGETGGWRAALVRLPADHGAIASEFLGGNQASVPAGTQVLLRLERPVSVASLRGPASRTAVGGGPWK